MMPSCHYLPSCKRQDSPKYILVAGSVPIWVSLLQSYESSSNSLSSHGKPWMSSLICFKHFLLLRLRLSPRRVRQSLASAGWLPAWPCSPLTNEHRSTGLSMKCQTGASVTHSRSPKCEMELCLTVPEEWRILQGGGCIFRHGLSTMSQSLIVITIIERRWA
jgi:hypothetical protein